MEVHDLQDRNPFVLLLVHEREHRETSKVYKYPCTTESNSYLCIFFTSSVNSPTIFIFISQYCINNLGINLHEHYRGEDQSKLLFGKQNVCQNFISIILSFEYPIISIIGMARL